MSRQFFFLLALLQAWIIGVDFLLGTGFTSAGVVTPVALLLALLLATSRKITVHVGGGGVGSLPRPRPGGRQVQCSLDVT